MARITCEEELEALLARPYPQTIEMMRRLSGDIIIIGTAGKIGPSLARLALEASRQAEVPRRIIGVDRFPEPAIRQMLERAGVETVACDLMDPAQVERLPKAENVIFMAGQKFGLVGSEPLLWAINTIVPANVARAFRESRIVAFSTGCVYSLVSPDSGGSKETDGPAPVGEYANSCLGRERVFEYYAQQHGTAMLFYRLNYAVELRYGVLCDIAERVYSDQPVDLSVAHANVIWQGDANNRALLSLEHTASPPSVLNVTGTETLSVREIAERFAAEFGTKARFQGEDSGKAYLSDASKSVELFGPPEVSVDTAISLLADWIKQGGRRLGKPTHFSVTDGQFLDKKA